MPTFLELGTLLILSGTDLVAVKNRLHIQFAEVHSLGVGKQEELRAEYVGCTSLMYWHLPILGCCHQIILTTNLTLDQRICHDQVYRANGLYPGKCLDTYSQFGFLQCMRMHWILFPNQSQIFFFQVTSKLAELPSVSFLFLGFCSVKLYSSILEEV